MGEGGTRRQSEEWGKSGEQENERMGEPESVPTCDCGNMGMWDLNGAAKKGREGQNARQRVTPATEQLNRKYGNNGDGRTDDNLRLLVVAWHGACLYN